MLVTLVKTISFTGFENETIVIKPGTELFVDTDNSIAFYNGLHFDIDQAEYKTSVFH